jgi:hypothetical protein
MNSKRILDVQSEKGLRVCEAKLLSQSGVAVSLLKDVSFPCAESDVANSLDTAPWCLGRAGASARLVTPSLVG